MADYMLIKQGEVLRGTKVITEVKQDIKARNLRLALQKLNDLNDIFMNCKDVGQ